MLSNKHQCTVAVGTCSVFVPNTSSTRCSVQYTSFFSTLLLSFSLWVSYQHPWVICSTHNANLLHLWIVSHMANFLVSKATVLGSGLVSGVCRNVFFFVCTNNNNSTKKNQLLTPARFCSQQHDIKKQIHTLKIQNQKYFKCFATLSLDLYAADTISQQ